jgi:hypothetical protein
LSGHTRADRSRNDSGDNAVYETESTPTSRGGTDRVLNASSSLTLFLSSFFLVEQILPVLALPVQV